MKRLALKAIASDDFEARKTGKAALMFFSEFEATSTDMNFARLQIIDNIMKLRNVLKIQ